MPNPASARPARSEISGLDYAAAGEGDGYLTLTNEAVEIVLLRSKARTDVSTVRVPRAENPGLVAALERWIAVAGIAAGDPLFRSIKKGGHIRERLREGGVSVALRPRPRPLLRRTTAGTAVASACTRPPRRPALPIEAVAALARHKSLNVAQKYAKQADQLRRAPSKNPALAI